MDDVYTPAEVATRLKLPLKTVLNYLRTGKLPGFKVGKHWRVKADDLEAFTQPPMRAVTPDPVIEGISDAMGNATRD